MRRAVSSLALLATLSMVAGCFGDGSSTGDRSAAEPQAAPPTDLSITTETISPLSRQRTVQHLTCGPAGGTVPYPAIACAALRRHPENFTGNAHVFIGLWGGGGSVTVAGRLNGSHVRLRYSFGEWPQARWWGGVTSGRWPRDRDNRPRPRCCLGRASRLDP